MPKLLPNTQTTQEMLGHVCYFHTLLKLRSEEKLTAITLLMSACEFSLRSTEKRQTVGTSAKIYLFALVLGLSITMADSAQEGD